jgi:hypothetical protein
VGDLKKPFDLFQAVDLGSPGIRALYKRIVTTLQEGGVRAEMPDVAIDVIANELAMAAGDVRDWDGGANVESAFERLKGAWRGSVTDLAVESPLVGKPRQSYSVVLDIEETPGGCHGKMAWTPQSMSGEQLDTHLYAVRLLVYKGDYVALEYRLDVPEASHFGIAALAIYGTGARMAGFHLARDLEGGGFVFGDFGVQKQSMRQAVKASA